MHSAILQQNEACGFATSVHRMGDYCELHAVPLPEGAPVYVARVDGDSDADVQRAAGELARMAGAVQKVRQRPFHGDEEAAVVESWREALRLLVADCKDDDVDDVLLAILNPAAGEDTARRSTKKVVKS